MKNVPLQQRAGRNIGNEVLPPIIHGAAMPELAVNPSGDTVLMEGQENVVRTPCVRTVSGNFGAIINQTAILQGFIVLFRDDEGNEMPISLPIAANAGDFGELNLGAFFAEGLFLGLCPGEKLILRPYNLS